MLNLNQVQSKFQKRAVSVKVSISFLTVLAQILGLFAVIGEHYCQTFNYAVLMTLECWVNIWEVIQSPINWLSLILDVVICILAYIFAANLRKVRHEVTCSQMTVPSVLILSGVEETSAPPINYTEYSAPPPPYCSPPSYVDALEIGMNHLAQGVQAYSETSGSLYNKNI